MAAPLSTYVGERSGTWQKMRKESHLKSIKTNTVIKLSKHNEHQWLKKDFFFLHVAAGMRVHLADVDVSGKL